MKLLRIVVATALSVVCLITNTVEAKQVNDTAQHIDTLLTYLAVPDNQHILVAAHRADWRNFPENSLEGVKSCIAMGVDIIEIDVQKTKDGQLVIMHDKTVDRTTNGVGKIADFTWEEIQKLKLKNAYGFVTEYKVPLLEDLLTVVKGKAFLFIDKAYKHMPDAWRIVEKTQTQKEALFEGHATLQELKVDYPEYIGIIRYMPRLDGDKKNIETLNYLNDYMGTKNLVATFILGYSKDTSPGIYYSAEIRKKNVSVMANALWPETAAGHDDDLSVNEPANGWGWLIEHGANILCTDRPQMLLNYLKINKQHN